MNKRSAAIMAAGLVAVLTLGGFAYSRGLTGPSVSVATARERAPHLKPIVRTHTKRVVVHRSAPAPAPRIVYSLAPSTSSAPATQDQSGSSDGMYDDEGEDNGFEGEEGQDDQQEQDNQGDDRYEGADD